MDHNKPYSSQFSLPARLIWPEGTSSSSTFQSYCTIKMGLCCARYCLSDSELGWQRKMIKIILIWICAQKTFTLPLTFLRGPEATMVKTGKFISTASSTAGECNIEHDPGVVSSVHTLFNHCVSLENQYEISFTQQHIRTDCTSWRSCQVPHNFFDLQPDKISKIHSS